MNTHALEQIFSIDSGLSLGMMVLGLLFLLMTIIAARHHRSLGPLLGLFVIGLGLLFISVVHILVLPHSEWKDVNAHFSPSDEQVVFWLRMSALLLSGVGVAIVLFALAAGEREGESDSRAYGGMRHLHDRRPSKS